MSARRGRRCSSASRSPGTCDTSTMQRLRRSSGTVFRWSAQEGGPKLDASPAMAHEHAGLDHRCTPTVASSSTSSPSPQLEPRHEGLDLDHMKLAPSTEGAARGRPAGRQRVHLAAGVPLTIGMSGSLSTPPWRGSSRCRARSAAPGHRASGRAPARPTGVARPEYARPGARARWAGRARPARAAAARARTLRSSRAARAPAWAPRRRGCPR